MSGTSDLEDIIADLVAGQQPSAPPSDPYVLTSKFTTELSKKANASDMLAFMQDTLAAINSKVDMPTNKPTVTGNKGGNIALAGVLSALANLNLITDSTT